MTLSSSMGLSHILPKCSMRITASQNDVVRLTDVEESRLYKSLLYANTRIICLGI